VEGGGCVDISAVEVTRRGRWPINPGSFQVRYGIHGGGERGVLLLNMLLPLCRRGRGQVRKRGKGLAGGVG